MLKKKARLKKFLFWFVLLSMVASLAVTIVMIAHAPTDRESAEIGVPVKSDYTLMVFQTVLGIFAMFLPSILEKRMKLTMPNFLFIFYILFLYGAIYLGEIRGFYYRFPNWDTVMHTCSGAMIGIVGFAVIDILNGNKRVSMQLSPAFVALFAFCFALTIGAVWEIFEFSADGLLGVNMQKFMLEDGTKLIGRAALFDTMEDLCVDAVGALFISVLGYVGLRRRKAAADIAEDDAGETADA